MSSSPSISRQRVCSSISNGALIPAAPSRRPLPGTYPAPPRPRRAHQRVPASRIETQVKTSGQVLKPHRPATWRLAALVIERPCGFAGHRVELASDEVTGPEAAHIVSEVLHRPIAHAPTVPGPLESMAPFFRWIAEVGFHADIRQLRTGYPEIGWQSLRHWAAARDWADLASP